MNELTRRSLIGTAGLATAVGAVSLLGAPDALAAPAAAPARGRSRQRPHYHFSVPDNWKNDPQRPVWIDGEYHYYYLYNADYLAGGGGTAWRRATTTDHVSFRDRGIAIPKHTNANEDVWSGSLVIDDRNTAGYGAGAVIALVTQAPRGVQAQYLWVSTDGGATFKPGSLTPALANPGVRDFRDPKVIWDEQRSRWAMALAEGHKIGFYTSVDLKSWQYAGGFVRDDLGLLECPDLFEMTADDGTSHWVLGVSANGKGRGLPATYAYWVGTFDGSNFAANHAEPEWLDRGFDFYGAATYEERDAHGRIDPSIRHIIGWANFWDYPHNTPTLATDQYNGDDMIVRDIRLLSADGTYYLVSSPTAALSQYARKTHRFGDVHLAGTHDLDVRALAYELTCEAEWDPSKPPGNIGFEVCRAQGGGRHVAAGIYMPGPFTYVNRRPTINPTAGESQMKFDPSVGSVSLRILVDRTSVEFFVGDGRVVHSHRVFPLEVDDRIRAYSHDGSATFRDLTITELRV
ncbi:MAG: glycoside hydrolase family 32 protein [Corynebacterium sp.]|uniref:glycoside hydrolase family 32 protein n=1 Tax=Corynebacterium sp. TaxID=1720 RepID=UPI0026DF0862|nr:glycoside hydrolase family 32 protein [Corynebacterium sp.]MDO5670124.1 glycoside hydrolase family 32 protein [Corynebacterium sp.]